LLLCAHCLHLIQSFNNKNKKREQNEVDAWLYLVYLQTDSRNISGELCRTSLGLEPERGNESGLEINLNWT